MKLGFFVSIADVKEGCLDFRYIMSIVNKEFIKKIDAIFKTMSTFYIVTGIGNAKYNTN